MRFHLKNLRIQRGAIWLAIFVAVGAVGGLAFIFSGAFNVAANERHFDLTQRIIKIVLDRSVAVRGGAGEPPADLGEDHMVRLGALHFATGCAACHGRPGHPASPIVQGMYPAPPPLDFAGEGWSSSELAWIVHSGFKMTGMPAWAGLGRADEVWPVIAYIEALPEIDAARYAALAGRAAATASGEALPLGDVAASVPFCEACHGAPGAPAVSDRVPPLGAQSPQYLLRALDEYRHDVRQSGMMEPIAAELTDDEVRALAAHFGKARAGAQPQSTPADRPGRGAPATKGEALARLGDPSRDIPACFGCHGADARPDFPRLQGLSEWYIANQLELFRSGVRARTPWARVMSKVAERLGDDDVKAVAAYLGGLGADADEAPVARGATP